MGCISSKSTDAEVVKQNDSPNPKVDSESTEPTKVQNDPPLQADPPKSVSPIPPSNVEPFQKEDEYYDFRPVHSAIRWKKPVDEVRSMLTSKRAANCIDEGNGNYPIHIAAQNGHLDYVNLLIEKGADVDAKNGKGNTALHMALSYDYYDCVQALIAAGANVNFLNDAGHPAKLGLDGDKSILLLALMSTKTSTEITDAMNSIQESPDGIDRASFAQTGLKLKKTLGDEWTPSVQEHFKSILSKLS